MELVLEGGDFVLQFLLNLFGEVDHRWPAVGAREAARSAATIASLPSEYRGFARFAANRSFRLVDFQRQGRGLRVSVGILGSERIRGCLLRLHVDAAVYRGPYFAADVRLDFHRLRVGDAIA
jgi:hypothetical protein